MCKYGMSMCTLGMAAELAADGFAVNSLWPRTTVATAAVATFFPHTMQASRTPAIMADAAYAILTRRANECTGNFFYRRRSPAQRRDDGFRGVCSYAGWATAPGFFCRLKELHCGGLHRNADLLLRAVPEVTTRSCIAGVHATNAAPALARNGPQRNVGQAYFFRMRKTYSLPICSAERSSFPVCLVNAMKSLTAP